MLEKDFQGRGGNTKTINNHKKLGKIQKNIEKSRANKKISNRQRLAAEKMQEKKRNQDFVNSKFFTFGN